MAVFGLEQGDNWNPGLQFTDGPKISLLTSIDIKFPQLINLLFVGDYPFDDLYFGEPVRNLNEGMKRSTPSSLQISPWPSRMYQNSLTVAWTVALFTWSGVAVLWIMLPVTPSIRKLMFAPAGDFTSGYYGRVIIFKNPP